MFFLYIDFQLNESSVFQFEYSDNGSQYLSKASEDLQFVEENNLYVGISQKFSALTEAKKQYQYALDALLIGQKRNSHCSCFDDCTLYIISDMISDRYDPLDICHPAVISLIHYDNEIALLFLTH
jgi:sugar diacid utilization regulator